MSEHNDPFYFALPAGARQRVHLSEAIGNIAERYGVTGRTQFVRRDPGFDLFKVVAR